MSVGEHRRPGQYVYVLDHDAGLRSVLGYNDRVRCRRHAVAMVADLPCGRWDPHADPPPGVELGLLVLDGLMIRNVTVVDARCGELIGPGAILRPWEEDGLDAPMRHDVDWQVIEPLRLAILDRRFLRVVAHWPQLINVLVARANERAQDLAVMVSIHSLKRVDVRLLALFWHLADRYGKVTSDGVLVPMALNHRQLALLIGVQRPSVTSALGTLGERGLLQRGDDESWLLSGDPPEEIAVLHTNGMAA